MPEYLYQNLYVYFCIFAIVTSITPGPNNLMLLVSGVNFGFLRTVPHVFGIVVGFFILLAATGFGIGSFLALFPGLKLLLKVIGGAYLVYLSFKLAFSRSFGASNSISRPLRSWEAIAFQWVNPKAWAMALSAMAIFGSDQPSAGRIMLICVGYALINMFSVLVWSACGQMIRATLADRQHLMWFNMALGLLLLVCVVPIVFS